MNLDQRLLRLVRESRVALVVTIGLGLAAGVFTVLQAGALSRVIARVFLGGESLAEVSGLLLSLLGVMVVRAVLVWGNQVSGNAIAIRVKTILRQALSKHILQRGPAFTQGEQSGELEGMLNKIADVFEKEVENSILRLTSYLEPVMILVMGCIVGFIVLSICLPIFEMNQLIR